MKDGFVHASFPKKTTNGGLQRDVAYSIGSFNLNSIRKNL